MSQEIMEHVLNVDVRAPREFSHTVTQSEREQGRIDWKERCGSNMMKMSKGEVTPLYK